MEQHRLDGKTAVVTGANSGIGRETALQLAHRGARVILGCRSQQHGEAALHDIIHQSGNPDVHLYLLDLASRESIRTFVNTFNTNESGLDILINNAGVFTKQRSTTAEGFEMMFGVNHLGHFLLTYLLLDRLKQSAPSRIVMVSSIGHEKYPLDFSDLQSEHNFAPLTAYCRSKTANILFAIHLAKVLQGTGVSTYSLHPGVIHTHLARDYEHSCVLGCFTCIWKYCLCRKIMTSEEGAQTTLYCALEPSIASHSGRYYSDEKEHCAKPHATDPDTAKRLWDISMALSSLDDSSNSTR